MTTNITGSGLNTQVALPRVVGAETLTDITGGTRPGGGQNLFHSFGQFDLGPNSAHVANFLNQGSVDLAGNAFPAGLATENIIGRVTGGNISQIYGTIRTTDFGNSNLFLLNPAGVLFGSGATLDIKGSLYVTTADYLRLTDGVRFSAIPDPVQDKLLTSAPVAAFGFLGPNFADITIHGLNVQGAMPTDPVTGEPLGQKVAFVGGNIRLGSDPESGAPSTVTAPGRRIQLTSVAGAGEVLAGTGEPTPGTVLGTVALDEGTLISTAGDPSFGDGSGGPIVIRGGKFVATSSALITGAIGDPGAPAGPGGSVIIDANDEISLTGSAIFTQSFLGGGGGDVTLRVGETGTIRLLFSQIFSDALFGGGSGGVHVRAPIVTMEGSQIFAETSGSGAADAGDIVFNVGRLDLAGFSEINANVSSDQARGGNITITGFEANQPADSVVVRSSFISSNTGAEGSGGNIFVDTRTATVADGGAIGSVSSGPGPGGTVTVRAVDDITLTGEGTSVSSFAQESGVQLASGAGGSIDLAAGDSIQVTNGATVNAQSSGQGNAGTITIQGLASPAKSVLIDGVGSGIFTDTQGTGAGGSINLFAQSFTLQNRATLSAATSGSATSATGGTIMINAILQDGKIVPTAAQSVTLSNGASISASSTGPANAGEIVINAGDQFLSTNSVVTTEAAQASGGSITLMATDMVHLINSKITTSVQGGAETRGGDITIDPQFVILQNSQIIAQAFQGQGGNITITAGTFLADPASVVSASSQLGVSGTVNIQSPVQNFSSSLAPLPKNFQSAAALLAQRCAARVAGGQVSTFVMAGREGLPAEPGGFLTSPPYRTSATGVAGDEPIASTPMVLVAMSDRAVSVRQGATGDRFPVWDVGCRFDSAER